MTEAITSISNLASVRRATIGVICGVVVALSTVVLLGLILRNEKLMGDFPGTRPMHPVTASLFTIVASSLWLSTGEPSRLKKHLGMICAVTVFLAGIAKLSMHLSNAGSVFDQFVAGKLLARMPADFVQRCHMAPTTYLNLALLAVVLICMHLRLPGLRLPAYILISIPALFSVATISRCYFVEVVPLVSDQRIFPMALMTASAILLAAGGMALELSNPTRRQPGSEDETADSSMKEKRVSLVNKVAFAFGSAVFMLCGIGIFSYQSIAEFIEDSRWDNHTYQVLAAIDLLYAQFKDAEGAERGYIITGDPKFLLSRQTAIDAIQPALENLQFLVRDNPAQNRRTEILIPLIQQKIDAVQTLTNLRRDKGFEFARQLLSEGPAVHLMEEIQHTLADMTSCENKLLDQRMINTQTNGRRGIALISFGAVGALALVFGAGWMLNRDIGGRELAEEALRSSENMFRGLLQSAPDAMVIATESGIIQLINTQAEQLFGYKSEQLIGQRIELIICRRSAAEDTEKRDSFFVALFKGEKGVDRDLFGIRSDGTDFPVEISLSPMKTPRGLCVSSAIRDVSRRWREEQASEDLNFALRASNAQLEAANKELESFSYSVSHDLRAPLRSIDGFSQAILEDYSDKLDAEGQEHLQRVRAASQRMGHLIDDLLNLSRVTRVEISREQVNLSGIAREIVEELKGTAPERDAEFIIADGMLANTDPRLIRIVMNNLLGNAWKFTAKRPHARIEFGRHGINGSTEYFVSDNGAGFDPTYASKLFGAFQRLHSTTEFAGTGIGLATVQRIVRRQGGRVWADGKFNEGATFHFTL